MLITQENVMRVKRDTSVPDLIEHVRRMDSGMLVVWVHGGKIVKVADVEKPEPIEKVLARTDKESERLDSSDEPVV